MDDRRIELNPLEVILTQQKQILCPNDSKVLSEGSQCCQQKRFLEN